MLPAFDGERMQALTGLMTALTQAETASWPTDVPFALQPRMQRLTLEIILRASFGLDQGSRLDMLRDALSEVLKFALNLLSVIEDAPRKLRWVPAVKRFNEARATADALTNELIAERRSDNETGGTDILSMLLQARQEDGSPMSDEEIRDELRTSLVGGHDTTAGQLSWGFMMLARAPEIAARIQDEIAVGGDAYLSAAIHEIMRLHPVAPNAEPRLTEGVEIGGWEYPPGVSLLACAHLDHHDPEIYPEPNVFNPSRFLDTKPATYTWLPFGGGRRHCIGAAFAVLEMKVVLARFDLRPAGSAKPEIAARRSLTASPDRGASVILTRRAAPAEATTVRDRPARPMSESAA
jgi:cytochrome P450